MSTRRRIDLQSRTHWPTIRCRSRGQSFVEYVLIILFVALAVVLALSLLGPQLSSIFRTISSSL